jgi:peptidoglycan/xylan/chitin deacetylase (PgdA/CDA1 family)
MATDPGLHPHRTHGTTDTAPWTLMYHSVSSGPDPHNVAVTAATLRRQLGWLRRCGLRGVSMRELLAAPRRKGLVGLTFDDGYADFATTAVPILRDHGFTATVYVLAGRFGGSNEWDTGPRRTLIDRAQVLEVAAAGMEIGSHGLTHVRLPSISDRDLADEVTESRQVLSELLGEPVAGFAYPYGELGGREVEAVARAGYRYACAVGHTEFARLPGLPLAVPRCFAGNRDGVTRLLAKHIRHGLRGRRGT